MYPEVTRCWKQTVKHMFKAAVMFAIMLTWEKDSDEARVFWTTIRDGENLTKNKPEYKLREYLKNTNATKSSATKSGATNAEITTKPKNTAKRLLLWLMTLAMLI